MNTLFKLTHDMTSFILDLWGENIANNNGTIIKNIVCEAFNTKFNLNIIYNKIEK